MGHILHFDSSGLAQELSLLEGYSQVVEIFHQGNNLTPYVAGGAVRDYLLSSHFKKAKDVDVFVAGQGFNELRGLFDQMGVSETTPFGSLRWRINAKARTSFDIIPFSEMATFAQKPATIIDVLSQFDITINAVATNLLGFDEVIYLPQAMSDIESKLIRIIRYDFSDEYISSTCPLSLLTTLWFRVVNYATTLKCDVEELTKEWIIENRWRLKYVKIFSRIFFTPDLSYLNTL